MGLFQKKAKVARWFGRSVDGLSVAHYPQPQVLPIEPLVIPELRSDGSQSSLTSYFTAAPARDRASSGTNEPGRVLIMQGFSSRDRDPAQESADITTSSRTISAGSHASPATETADRLRRMRHISADISVQLAEKDLAICEAELQVIANRQRTLQDKFDVLHQHDDSANEQLAALAKRLDATELRIAVHDEQIVAVDDKSRRNEADVILIRTALQEVLDVLRSKAATTPVGVMATSEPRPKLHRSNATRAFTSIQQQQRIEMERYKRECLDRYDQAQAADTIEKHLGAGLAKPAPKPASASSAASAEATSARKDTFVAPDEEDTADALAFHRPPTPYARATRKESRMPQSTDGASISRPPPKHTDRQARARAASVPQMPHAGKIRAPQTVQ